MAAAFVGLGGNLGDPAARIRRVIAELDALDECRVERASSLYLSEPWGRLDQPAFVNAVARLATSLRPARLLEALLATERRHGRVRDDSRWGPRTLDLDLLVVDGQRIDDPALTVPHPRIHERAFVLVPLAEIEPDLVVPGQGRVRDLLARVDATTCRRLP